MGHGLTSLTATSRMRVGDTASFPSLGQAVPWTVFHCQDTVAVFRVEELDSALCKSCIHHGLAFIRDGATGKALKCFISISSVVVEPTEDHKKALSFNTHSHSMRVKPSEKSKSAFFLCVLIGMRWQELQLQLKQCNGG